MKLELPPASLRALKKVPLFKTPPRHTSEVSVYFDTDKHKLRKNGLYVASAPSSQSICSDN